MWSLDTLSLLRPKAEAGRASAGEDPRADGASGFEAVLDAFESGTAPTGEAPAEPAEAGADAPPALPSDALPATPTDATGSALQALMALAGPTAAPVLAAKPDSSLEAMVQRAAVSAGSGPSPTPTAPALPMTLVGLETHFAPVRPHEAALPTGAGTGPAAGGALASPAIPAPDGRDADAPLPILGDGARPPSLAPIPTALDTTALDTTAPIARDAGTAKPPLPDAETMPPGEVRRPALETDDPVPARGVPAQAAQAPVDRPSAAAVAPVAPPPTTARAGSTEIRAIAANAAMPVQPAPLGHGQDQAVGAKAASAVAMPAPEARQPAGAPPAQPAAPGALGNTASRGRPALRNDRSEPAGAAELAAPIIDPATGEDRAEPPAVIQAAPTGQAERGPEPVREHQASIARPEPAAERAAASMPRAEADGGTSTASAGPSAEAPRPEMPLAEPAVHEVAGAQTQVLAPVPTSPLRQIVDAVAAQLPAAAPGAQVRPLPASGESGPLKILTLQLHPADLGSVLVRMRLQDGRLEMSLRTSREDTAERLRKEGELLSGLLREAGYEPDTVTIQAGGTGPGESGARGQGFASFAGSQAGPHDRQPGAATPDQSGRRPSPRADEAATPTEEQDHETDSRGRDRGGLYL